MMPGIDGFETCNRLKADPNTAAIPILFMTALSELGDLLRGFGEGAVDYLVKPIRPPEVLARVDTHLKQSRNVQRAENALNNGPCSALAISASTGVITWLPEAGVRWLGEFMQPVKLVEAYQVGELLPAPLLNWVKSQIETSKNGQYSVFECIKGGNHFSVKLSSCLSSDEYLLLMEKRSKQWNLDSVRNALGLTLREAEILMWISRGKTNKEVGLILGSSPRTVNKHLEHIFEKLGVVTRAAAVSIAVQRTPNLAMMPELMN
jgi:DNA-binding NarL/FixJ family response regulator